jgi:hypothetical protein
MNDRKIVGYQIIDTDEIDFLNEEVLELIEDGWQPFGPCQYSESTNDEFRTWSYVQTMVKYAEPNQ